MSTAANRVSALLLYRIRDLITLLGLVFKGIRIVPDVGLPSKITLCSWTISKSKVCAVPLLDYLLYT